jgi:outer membrane protein OmpA-like peptidoglycan-associated protein
MVKVLAVLAGATLVASGCTTAPSVPAIPKAKKSEDTVIAPAPAPAAKSSGFVYNGDNSVVESDDGCVRASGWSADLPNCGEAPAPVVEDVKELPAVAKPAQPEPVYVRETLNGNALFDVNSADLSAAGMLALEDLVDRIGEVTGAGSIEVVGHTDDTGAAEYNMQLSAKRAQRVENFLKSKITGMSITSSAQGELSPIADNSTEEGRAQNRRVEVLVSRSKLVE